MTISYSPFSPPNRHNLRGVFNLLFSFHIPFSAYRFLGFRGMMIYAIFTQTHAADRLSVPLSVEGSQGTNDTHPQPTELCLPRPQDVGHFSARRRPTAESSRILCCRVIPGRMLLQVLYLVTGSDTNLVAMPWLARYLFPHCDRKSALAFRSHWASRRLIIRGYWVPSQHEATGPQ
jgi:hypothetical protein